MSANRVHELADRIVQELLEIGAMEQLSTPDILRSVLLANYILRSLVPSQWVVQAIQEADAEIGLYLQPRGTC